MSTPKGQQRPDAPDTVKLMDLLVMKDKEIKENLRIAADQAEIQKTVDELKLEISSEELIKFAHRISASNAVASPPTWVP
ncbi:hypothetical protein KUTeg_022459, partial [Tegillarca granosa]